MKAPSNGFSSNLEGEKRNINSELWHACAGPLVSLPPVGSLVVYFPQGHSEQVAASMQKETDFVPSYPSLPSKLICILHNVTLNADAETDEVYAQMTLQPVNKYDREALLASDMGLKHSKQPAEFFCKTLTASDTSTHGGFSVPRRAAEKIFPSLDYSMQPPAQELVAKDLHDAAWTFRHIFRGQPKRHLLTTGWSVFVSTKRLFAGDSVLFIRDEKSQLLLGIRRANRQQSTLSSSVLSSDSMHIGVLAAAAHAAANNSPFTVFYNPRASPSEFVIPLAKYQKAMYTQVSLGMRFRMMFETEDSGVRRYMGTITGISDLDSSHWKNSQWRNLQVGWDESTTGERRTRVSVWEIEPVATPFYICPPPFYRPKLPRQPGMPDDESEIENAFKRAMPWLGDDLGFKDSQNSLFPGFNLVQWMSMQQQQNSRMMGVGTQSGFYPSALATPLPSNPSIDPSKILNFQAHSSFPVSNSHFSVPKPNQPTQQLDQPPQPSLAWPQQQQQPRQSSAISPQPAQPPPQSTLTSVSFIEQDQQRKQQYFANQSLLQPQTQNQNLQQSLPQSQLPQQRFITPNSQLQQNIHHPNQVSVQQQNFHFQTQQPQQQEQQHQQEQQKHHHLHQQQQSLSQVQQQQLPQLPLSEHQLRLQLLQKLQQQQKLFSQVPSQLPQQLPQAPNQNTQFHYHQQQPRQFNETQFSPIPLINQPQQFSSNNPPQENISNQPSQQVSPNCILGQAKSPLIVRAHSTLTDGDAPCSTSPSSNNCTSSSIGLSKATHQAPLLISEDMIIQPEATNNFVQEIQSKSDICVKNELHTDKGPDQLTYGGGAAIDRLNASSSATSFYLEGSIQQNFSMPMLGLDGDLQVDPRNNLLFGVNIDDLTPDTLLSRGFDSEKDLQNLLSSYNNQRDIERELSTAGISPQALGVPEMSFKPGCSVDPLISETGILNRGPWANQQPQRMRTFTKVHKRGSVGRSIDVTRYRGYEDLTHDIACMFGIEGQLEDPYRTDWQLVYVDNEKDILLLGDDPWEEFLSCVQSIKILSSAEVQQMSLDGDLANMPIQNQACSGSDSGNV